MHEEPTAETNAEVAELLELIDTHLPIGLRAAYLKMQDGVRVPKEKRVAVEQAVSDILSRHGIDFPANARPLAGATFLKSWEKSWPQESVAFPA